MILRSRSRGSNKRYDEVQKIDNESDSVIMHDDQDDYPLHNEVSSYNCQVGMPQSLNSSNMIEFRTGGSSYLDRS